MLENCRELIEKQKRFLKEQGLNPEEFLSLGTAADYYKFYHIKKEKEVVIRRQACTSSYYLTVMELC